MFDGQKAALFWAAVIGLTTALVVGPFDAVEAPLFPSITAGAFSLLLVGAVFGERVESDQRPGVTRPVS